MIRFSAGLVGASGATVVNLANSYVRAGLGNNLNIKTPSMLIYA